MQVLDKKLLRDLWRLRSIIITIALVLAGGVATFCMSISTYDSLLTTQKIYYREQRFADVFVNLKRAPEKLITRIEQIKGVEKVTGRIVAAVHLDVENYNHPVNGLLVSVQTHHRPLLNDLYLRTGRWIEDNSSNEVMISETFANAHRFKPGDGFHAVINGKREKLTIAGIVLSPEFIYELGPGSVFPDDERFGVIWMSQKQLAVAYDMEGAINDISLSVSKDTNVNNVIDELDQLLIRYGGTGAYKRKDQFSHNFLQQELNGLKTMANVFPVIFLGVAAFLINIVISRLIATEREQIAVLKAFGYRKLSIGWHYAKFALLIVFLGTLIGVLFGIWLGKGLSNLYMINFHFPFLYYELRPQVIVNATLIACVAGLSGAMWSVMQVIKLTPAEGMRPPAPEIYSRSGYNWLGLSNMVSQSNRMVLRHLRRRPLRALMTIFGIAAACGIIMLSNFQRNSIQHMIDVHYAKSYKQDISVSLTDPVSSNAESSIKNLPGVNFIESYRVVPINLHAGHREFRTSLLGVEPTGKLQRILNQELEQISLPDEGVVLTDYLAELLNVSVGDELTFEILERRAVDKVRDHENLLQPYLKGYRFIKTHLAATTKQYLGVSAFMQKQALNKLMNESKSVNAILLEIDQQYVNDIIDELNQMPKVSGIIEKEAAIDKFYQTMDETILVVTVITSILGSIIAFGVVYNSARIALSERGRELASLRILGFTVGEIGYILLGELLLLTIIAIPLGFIFGYGICSFLATQMGSELYRIPLVLFPSSYAFITIVIVTSAIFSGLLVLYRLHGLDLISVLKTRE